MRRSTKFLIGYFLFFIGLSAIAMAPGGALIVLLITGMALPLFGDAGSRGDRRADRRYLFRQRCCRCGFRSGVPRIRLVLAAVALLVPAAIAIGPGLSRERRRGCSRQQMGKDDMSRPATPKPKSIELEWRRHVGPVRLRGNGRRRERLLQRDLPAAAVQRRSGLGADDTNAGHLHEPAGGIDPERHLSHRASGILSAGLSQRHQDRESCARPPDRRRLPDCRGRRRRGCCCDGAIHDALFQPELSREIARQRAGSCDRRHGEGPSH